MVNEQLNKNSATASKNLYCKRLLAESEFSFIHQLKADIWELDAQSVSSQLNKKVGDAAK